MDHVFAQSWTDLTNTCSLCGKKCSIAGALIKGGCTGDPQGFPRLIHRGTQDVWMIAPNNNYFVYSGDPLPFPMEGTDRNNQPVTYYGDGHDYDRWTGVLRGKTDFNDDDKMKCVCPVSNLLSTGHDAGCPEKK